MTNAVSDVDGFFDGGVVVLDGGFGTHLETRGNDVSGELWSAQILREKPGEIRAAHGDFYRAGAQVATTCSYQVTFDGLAAIGVGDDEVEDLLRLSVWLAREAADSADGRRWVAASVGPYGAGPGEGTEYDGAYGLGVDDLARWHRRRIEVLADTDADVILAETVPSIIEVEALVRELDRAGKPAMLSMSVTKDSLNDGSSLRDAARIISGSSGIRAVGVNCCSADDALESVRVLADELDLPLVAYPNSGETWDRENRVWVPRVEPDGTESASVLTNVPALLDSGVRFIGGCCRVTPEEIEAIAELVHRR